MWHIFGQEKFVASILVGVCRLENQLERCKKCGESRCYFDGFSSCFETKQNLLLSSLTQKRLLLFSRSSSIAQCSEGTIFFRKIEFKCLENILLLKIAFIISN